MESSNFGECFAHYPLKSRPVSRRAYVSLSAQATGLGILAEIAVIPLAPAQCEFRVLTQRFKHVSRKLDHDRFLMVGRGGLVGRGSCRAALFLMFQKSKLKGCAGTVVRYRPKSAAVTFNNGTTD
jgi:hypothetical protein